MGTTSEATTVGEMMAARKATMAERTTRYLVMERRAKMPTSCMGGGSYRRIAVVEVDPAVLAAEGLGEPRMIASRARGVVRIVATWERRYDGLTERCAAGRARAAAAAMVANLAAR